MQEQCYTSHSPRLWAQIIPTPPWAWLRVWVRLGIELGLAPGEGWVGMYPETLNIVSLRNSSLGRSGSRFPVCSIFPFEGIHFQISDLPNPLWRPHKSSDIHELSDYRSVDQWSSAYLWTNDPILITLLLIRAWLFLSLLSFSRKKKYNIWISSSDWANCF